MDRVMTGKGILKGKAATLRSALLAVRFREGVE